mmetsp:Transcript_22784/g.54534  ORF Transcript_22784/g.54534 Transcript_22784/m.54534 type:complete len:262 (+) Transcript_22784:284-1069(+)
MVRCFAHGRRLARTEGVPAWETVPAKGLDEVSNVCGELLDGGVVELLDVLQHAIVVQGDEVDGNTLAAKAPGAANAVEVVLRLGGEVVVDDKGDLLHVDTAGEEVGGDQDPGRARPELAHDHIAGVLVHVAVGGGHGVVALAHHLCEPVNLAAGVGEDHRLGDGQGLVEIAQGLQLPFLLLNEDIELLDTLEGELVALDQDSDRVVHKLAGDLQRLRGEGSRENADLELGREELEDVIDLVLEPTGEHLIGLVKHKHLDRV